MGAVARIARAAKSFVSLATLVNVRQCPFPHVAAFFKLPAFAGRLPFIDGRQAAPDKVAIRNRFVERDQRNRIVVRAGRIAAIDPVLRRGVARGHNKPEVLAIRHFAWIKSRAGKNIDRQEKCPEEAHAPIFGSRVFQHASSR